MPGESEGAAGGGPPAAGVGGLSDFFGGFAFADLFGLAGFVCPGGTAGVAGVAGLVSGGRAGCAGTARTARACEPRTSVCVPRPLEVGEEVGEEGGAEAAEGVRPCPPPVDGPDGVPLPPVVGWPETGVPGTGDPGAGTPPPPAAGPGMPPPKELGPDEIKIGVKPVNGDGDTGGLALAGLAGSKSAGTLRSCEPGTASSRIAECSSTTKACIQSCADATAPAATAPT